ncbi:MAG: hypothetical protein K2Q97_14870 [Burkholderiaceae bacterium]|nr:hypothetical protein [Burkholderiaceae bacterium]
MINPTRSTHCATAPGLIPGGIAALARRFPMSPKVLYNKFEGNNDTHHLRFDEWDRTLGLVVAAKVPDAYAPLRALNWRHDHVAVYVPMLAINGEASLSSAMVSVVREIGDVAAELESGMRDRRLNAREYAKLDRQIGEAIAALTFLRAQAAEQMKGRS